MHKLLDVSSFIFEEMTDDFSDKQIGNEFWKFTKTKFLDDNTKKIKVVVKLSRPPEKVAFFYGL